jgi:opacity protein-like surface antigen
VQVGDGKGLLEPPQGEYKTLHCAVAFGQSLNATLADKLNWDAPGEWSFRIMPWASYVSSPDSNAEVGCMASLKIGFPVGDRLLPYIAGGTGPMYTTQGTQEQSTRFNFASYGALGLQYRLDESSALSVEVWKRHFSNGSVKDPNDGVDTTAWTLAYTLFKD